MFLGIEYSGMTALLSEEAEATESRKTAITAANEDDEKTATVAAVVAAAAGAAGITWRLPVVSTMSSKCAGTGNSRRRDDAGRVKTT